MSTDGAVRRALAELEEAQKRRLANDLRDGEATRRQLANRYGVSRQYLTAMARELGIAPTGEPKRVDDGLSVAARSGIIKLAKLDQPLRRKSMLQWHTPRRELTLATSTVSILEELGLVEGTGGTRTITARGKAKAAELEARR